MQRKSRKQTLVFLLVGFLFFPPAPVYSANSMCAALKRLLKEKDLPLSVQDLFRLLDKEDPLIVVTKHGRGTITYAHDTELTGRDWMSLIVSDEVARGELDGYVGPIARADALRYLGITNAQLQGSVRDSV